MYRPIEYQTLSDGIQHKVFFGLSTDTKPDEELANGSMCVEMDTGVVWFYDEENAEWIKPGGESNE